MKTLLITMAAAMLILHQDFWLWENTNLFFGFLPMGLAYHVGFSMAVVLLALLAIRFAWPHDLERWAAGKEVKADPKQRDSGDR